MRLIDADALKEHFKIAWQGRASANLMTLLDEIDGFPAYEPPVPDYPRSKSRDELLTADWGTLTEEEKERRARAKAIPEAIVEACANEYSRLRAGIIRREEKMDAIANFVSGERMRGYD